MTIDMWAQEGIGTLVTVTAEGKRSHHHRDITRASARRLSGLVWDRRLKGIGTVVPWINGSVGWTYREVEGS